jgi:hypothetical protein
MVSRGEQKESRRGRDSAGSVGRQALGAIVLLGAIIFLLSQLPAPAAGSGTYRRDLLAVAMCEAVGIEPDTAPCVAVSMGGWLVIVVTVGIILKVGRSCSHRNPAPGLNGSNGSNGPNGPNGPNASND